MIGTFSIPTPEQVTEWVRPADWIDITNVGDNKINLLVAETVGIAFKVITSSGTYNIDWGDGTSTLGA